MSGPLYGDGKRKGIMATGLSDQTRAKVDDFLARYPVKQGALLPILHAVQADIGAITPEAIEWVAEKTETPPSTVFGVVTFYPMFRMEKVGKYHVQVCATVPCAVCGGRELLDALEKQLGVGVRETTADGKFTVDKVECLAACGDAPAVLVNRKLYRKVTAESVAAFLARIEKDDPR